MKYKILLPLLLTLTACSMPVDQVPSPIAPFTETPQVASTSTEAAPAIPTTPPAFCNDKRGLDLITSLSTAIATKDGALFSSLISPVQGVNVLYFREGKVVNYDVEHAKFVFETTFQADWGLSFGSGEPTLGSFQEIVLPDLQLVFTPTAEIVCQQLKVGGATYVPEWPYPYLDYYSVHYAGTDEFGGLNWQTWGVGMDSVDGKPYIAALVHYVWEP